MKQISKHIVKRNNIGISGNLFGGWLMYWLDEAGAIFASVRTFRHKAFM